MFHVGHWIEDQYLVLEKNATPCWIDYLVRDRISENIFVIKRPSDIMLADKSAAVRFSGKARVWINLGEREEIVNAYMVKEYGGVPHIFLEYVGGPTLANLLHTHSAKPLPLEQTLALLKQLISGMKFLHNTSLLAEGTGAVIHGGLNPHAILVKEGTIKITDIGLAWALRQSYGKMSVSSLLHELPYLAPEQREDAARADELTDIYSFGAVAYEAATGAPPGIGKKTNDAMHDFVASHYVSPRLRNRSCPQWLEETILKCMVREPENRFQNLGHIDAFLTEVLKAENIPRTRLERAGEEGRVSRVAKVRGRAKKESRGLNHYYLGVEHLILGLLEEEESLVVSCLGDKYSGQQLRAGILARLPKGEGPWYWEGIVKTPRYTRTMSAARSIRRECGHDRMLPQHLLLAILQEGKSLAVRTLKEMGVNNKTAADRLLQELKRQTPALVAQEPQHPIGKFTRKIICAKYLPSAIPFFGRGEEVRKAIGTLTDENKSIIIAGAPGVGKTALIQELDCHLGKSFSDSGRTYGGLYELKKADLFAGTDDDEENGAQLDGLLNSIVEMNGILVIEGIDTLLGMGFRSQNPLFVETLCRLLDSHELLFVATATPEALLSCEIESKDIVSQLEIIRLEEPSQELMLNILAAVREILEEMEHSIEIDDAALTAALDLPYAIDHLVLPAKAVELVSRACFSARLQAEPNRKIRIDSLAIEDFIKVHL